MKTEHSRRKSTHLILGSNKEDLVRNLGNESFGLVLFGIVLIIGGTHCHHKILAYSFLKQLVIAALVPVNY
jgi:hypothetical protein